MKRLLLFLLLAVPLSGLNAQDNWQAQWITDPNTENAINSWYCFRKDLTLETVPSHATAKIAIDSKYWLWINGVMVVFEGGLKRGPTPTDTYYDTVDITNYLTQGANTISVLGWYFGKNGFSHISSGQFGFIFECITPGMSIISDSSWKVIPHPAYQTCPPPLPNYRLPESSIRFDARNDIGHWFKNDYPVNHWNNAKMLGIPPITPWNHLIPRPIPQWKDSKLLDYVQAPNFPLHLDRDTTIVCALPANLQITPYLKIEAQEEGQQIEIKTDHFMGGGAPNVYAQYISRRGIQDYESYGWMNGHHVIYTIPAGITVLDLKYRETGYNTEFTGNFTSSDAFLNTIRQKSLRTLYVTMRDTYMDCPDRERAQWWGDLVNESGEAFYALDPRSHLLCKKGMYELINWQRPDSTLYSPIPSGNWKKELPVQMLASIGYYGFWNYYLNTGDRQTIADLYHGVRKYLKLWQVNDDGSIRFRPGGWAWGDWGQDIDMELITNGFYYLALQGALTMAETLNLNDDASEYTQSMKCIQSVFNTRYWTGTAYRHPDYQGETDDRCQALAVVSGIADSTKYPALLETFKTEEHASPYMEKYVMEALFQMGYADYAIERMKKRFGAMVNHPDYTTLFEGWGIGAEGYGGGTVNHAWSGGALTILSQYLCGIAPIKPGYEVFQIVPNPGPVKTASATVQSVKGIITSCFENSEHRFKLTVTIPSGTQAIIGIPADKTIQIKLNGVPIWKKEIVIGHHPVAQFSAQTDRHILFRIDPGDFVFEASRP